MPKPDTLIIDGHAFSWQRLVETRRRQLEAWRARKAAQLALFDLAEDYRPAVAKTSAQRYIAPTFLDMMREQKPSHN